MIGWCLGRSRRPESDGPGLLPVAHVPEHPFVAARRAEVPVHQRALVWREVGAELVGDRQYILDGLAELIASVHVDPPLVTRIGRAAALQLLADLPVEFAQRLRIATQ